MAENCENRGEMDSDFASVHILPDGRMDRRNAAKYLGCAKRTLEQWAWEGQGPRVVRVGKRCFYFKQDLDDFIRGGAA